MSAPQHIVAQKLRISVEELKTRQQSGEPIMILDARKDKSWESSPVKIQGAIRFGADDGRVDLSWPKDRFTAVY